MSTYIALTLFGFIAIYSGKASLLRGRGGKMSRNGLLITLIGYLCVIAGLHGLFGDVGALILGTLYLSFWIGRFTGLNNRFLNWLRYVMSPKE
jgi:hypothetical protein